MYCPICDSDHEVDIVSREDVVIIKGKPVRYTSTFYRCMNKAEDNEFVNGTMLTENLLRAKCRYCIGESKGGNGLDTERTILSNDKQR